MLSLFQGLAQVITDFGEWLLPFSVLKEYEGGILLHLGRVKGVLGPGFVWHWPFGMEEVLKVNTAFDTRVVNCQGLATRDGVQVSMSVAVGYRITDVRKFLIDVEDTETVMVDATAGTLYESVTSRVWDDVRAVTFTDEVYRTVRRRAFKYGITVESVFFRSFVRLGLREGAIFVFSEDLRSA